MVVNHYKGMKLAIHSLPFFLFFHNLRSILFSRQTFAKSHGGIFLVHFIGRFLTDIVVIVLVVFSMSEVLRR